MSNTEPGTIAQWKNADHHTPAYAATSNIAYIPDFS